MQNELRPRTLFLLRQFGTLGRLRSPFQLARLPEGMILPCSVPTHTKNQMPSLSISTALLLLGRSDGLPWTTSTWQDHTQVVGVPWKTESGSDCDMAAPNVPSWTTQMAQSVESYATNLWLASETAVQAKYSQRKFSDNNSVGRSKWNKWVQNNWNRRWNISHLIDQVFIDHKCSPYDVLARAKQTKVSA